MLGTFSIISAIGRFELSIKGISTIELIEETFLIPFKSSLINLITSILSLSNMVLFFDVTVSITKSSVAYFFITSL